MMVFSTFTNNYSYEPLEKGSIRHLIVEPGAQDDRINCHIVHSKLSNSSKGKAHQYEALSYAWGNQSDPSTISIDGSTVKVTKNLEEALRAVRLRDKPRTIWADALCINQQDIPERNDQVSRMQDIYSQAIRVLIWLGLSTETSDEAIDFIFRQPFMLGLMWQKYDTEGFTREELQLAHEMLQKSAYPTIWKSLAELCSREYWERLWIVQEIVLSKDIEVICGSKKIPWDILDCFVSLAWAVSSHLPEGMSGLNNDLQQIQGASKFIRTAQHRRKRPRNPTIPLNELMSTYRSSHCSNSRDLVYSMLGLTNAADFPVIDYALSVKDVYTLAFKYCAEKSRSLNVISNHQFRMGADGPGHVEDLPSWLPDWRSLWFAGDIITASGQVEKPFNASGGHQPVIQYLNNNRVLSVRGFVLDRIGHTDPPVTVLGDSMRNQEFQYVAGRVVRWYKLANSKEVTKIRQFDKDAFWRTLVVDAYRIGSLRDPPEQRAIEVDPSKSQITFYGSNYFKGAMIDHLRLCQYLRKFSITAKGLYCMSSICTDPGDVVCIIYGCDTPVVLRKAEGHFLFIGDCYADGMMRGEAMDRLGKGDYKLQTFDIW